MTVYTVPDILDKMGIVPPYQYSPLQWEEGVTDYDAFRVQDRRTYVLKKSSEQECTVYETFLGSMGRIAPRLYKSAEVEGETYLLLEYVPGEKLCKCTRPALTAALDTLIRLQDQYWERRDLESFGYGYPASLKDCQDRAACLNVPDLEAAYPVFLDLYASVPRTLCPDLRPSNILMQRDRAVLTDWAYAGILPYPTALARLIAHGEEDKNAAFSLSPLDREFAIHYFFTHFTLDKGIPYEEYRRTLDYFLLDEYCVRLMQEDRSSAYRFRRHLTRITEFAKRLQ